jgi:hypothetical protein
VTYIDFVGSAMQPTLPQPSLLRILRYSSSLTIACAQNLLFNFEASNLCFISCSAGKAARRREKV